MTENSAFDLVVIGDIAFERDVTEFGDKISLGGSGYYSTRGASKFSKKVGLVSRVGFDFDLSTLTSRGIDVSGVKVDMGNKTARFSAYHYPDKLREFKADRGAGEIVDTEIFPDGYLNTGSIHLSTSTPERYLIWLEYLTRKFTTELPFLSVDVFEEYAIQQPDLYREVFKFADLVFLNEFEWSILNRFDSTILNGKDYILKKGARGASYISPIERFEIKAPQVKNVDPTGAGDVLAGSFLALKCKGLSKRKALIEAVKAASLSVTDFGVQHI